MPVTEVQFDAAAPQDADPVDAPNGPDRPKPNRKQPSRSSRASEPDTGKGKGGNDDGSAEFKDMASSEDAQDQFAQALLGKDYSELTAEEKLIIDKLIEDILAGNIKVVVVNEGDGVVIPDENVQGAFEAGENGEPGTIYIADDLTDAEIELVLKEEFGEAIAHRAEEIAEDLGVEFLGGDAGNRLLIVSNDGFVDLELTPELFMDRASDTSVILVNGEEVVVKTRQSVDPDNNAALDFIEYFLAPREIGHGSRPNDVHVNENGDIIISGIDDDGSSFEITITLGEDTSGEPTMTFSGTRTNLDGTTEPLFPTHTITGEDAVNNAVLDINTLFDDASIAVATGAYSFVVEADLVSNRFSVVQSGDEEFDDLLHLILIWSGANEFTSSHDEDGNLVMTGELPDGSVVEFTFTFTVGDDGEPVMTITSTIDMPGSGDGPQPFLAPVTVTGQDNITAAVGSMNDRFSDAGLTSPGRDEFFEVAPDFVAGGFYSLTDVDLTQTRVVFDDVPENAEAGDIVGEVEVFVNGRWVPLSQLPPAYQNRVTVELSNSNGSLDVLPNGQIVVAEPSGLVDGLKIDVLVTSDGTDTTSSPIEYDVPVVDVDETFVPTQSANGDFVEGKTTVGIPEDVEHDEPIILTGDDAEVWGTSKVAVVTYIDADGNTVTVILDADPDSANFMGVLTTFKEVEGEGIYVYDAQGNEVGFSTETTESDRSLSALPALDTGAKEDDMVEWASRQGTVTSSGSNSAMAWVYWTDADGVQHVTYSYIDPVSKIFVTSTAERGSAEAVDFATARDLYNKADREQGLLGQQVVTQFVGASYLSAVYRAIVGTVIARGATPALAEAAGEGGKLKVAGGLLFALPGTHGGYYDQQRVNALGLLTKHNDVDNDFNCPWDVDPTPPHYGYVEGDPIPPALEEQTPAAAVAIIEIDEAEEANRQAETAIVNAEEKERHADAAEHDALEAEHEAAQAPGNADLQETAATKRAEADAARAEADAANAKAATAGEHAAKETEEAVEAANASGDPELIALASSQADMLASLIALLLVVAEENDARDAVIEARRDALETYPDGEFPHDVQQNLNELHADWTSATEQRHEATLTYLDARKDNAALYLAMKTEEHQRLVAAAKREKYEEYEAQKDFDDAVANGGDVEGTLAVLNEKKAASDDASSRARAAEADFREARDWNDNAVNAFDTALEHATDNVAASWEFDPQDTTDGATPLVPTTDEIVDKDVYTGPAIEDTFGTSAVMVVESMNGDVKTTTIINVDPASATYGEALGKVVETPGTDAVVYDGDGNQVGTLTQDEVDAANGITDDGPVGDDHSRNLANESADNRDLASRIPAGATRGTFHPGKKLCWTEYTGSDGRKYAIVKHTDKAGKVTYRTILLTDTSRRQLSEAAALVNNAPRTLGLDTIGGAAFYVGSVVTGGGVVAGLSGTSKANQALEILGYSATTVGLTGVILSYYYTRRNTLSSAGDGHANTELVLDSSYGAWIPAHVDPEGVHHPAGIDLNDDGNIDVLLAEMQLVRLPGEDHFTLVTPAGLHIPLVNAAGVPHQVIQGANGGVGFDVDGDGLVDVPIPEDAQVAEVDGVAGFLMPGGLGGDDVFIPFPQPNTMTPQIVIVGGIPMVQIGNLQFLMQPNAGWQIVMDDVNPVLNVGGQNFALPLGWIIVNGGGTGHLQIQLRGDPPIVIANLDPGFTPNIVFNDAGVPFINLAGFGAEGNIVLDDANIIIGNNGAVGVDRNGDGIVDTPVADEFTLVFGANGVGIMVGQPPTFLAVGTSVGSNPTIIYKKGSYHIVVNGKEIKIEGDIPSNVIVTEGTHTAPAGQVAMQIQFGLNGPVFQFNVARGDLTLGVAPDPLPADVPADAVPVQQIPLPGGGNLTPPTGQSWFLTVAGLILVRNSAPAP